MKTRHSSLYSRSSRTLLRSALVALALVAIGAPPAPTFAQSRTLATGSGLSLAANAPDSYTVKQGDTLWDIAKTYLNQPWYWPELWYLNPQVQNPHLIYPGDVLKLVSVDGQTRLTIGERGPNADVGSSGMSDGNARIVSGNGVRLSPQVRVQDMGNAISTIAYKDVAAFLGRPSIISAEEEASGPHLLAPRNEHTMGAAGDEFYVAGLGDTGVQGARYNVLHVENELKDPETREVLGYRASYVGNGPLVVAGDPGKLKLAETVREALRGDRVYAEQYQLNTNFIPHAADKDIGGSVIAIADGTQAGRYQVVAINRGTNSGATPGQVMAIYQAGRVVKDVYASGKSANPMHTPSPFKGTKVQLPDERIGTLMVFKTFERMSYALVMDAEVSVKPGDILRNP